MVKLKRKCVKCSPQADTSAVEGENKQLKDHCDAVQDKLTDAINKDKKILADLEEYWEQEEKLDKQLKETGTQLEENKPMVMDIEKLKEQLGRTQVCCVVMLLLLSLLSSP